MILLNDEEVQMILGITNKVEISGNEAILRVGDLVRKLATSLQPVAVETTELPADNGSDELTDL